MKPHLRLINGEPVPVHVFRLPKPDDSLPQPVNVAPWPVGQGPRYWTLERIAALQDANARMREIKSAAR